MNDTPEIPAAPKVEKRASRRGMISAVWLVPIIAILVALAIGYQSWSQRGVLITVSFPDASGVTAGATTLRYREVVVGVVEEVGFTSDLRRVNAFIRVNKDIAPFLDEDASFWVVQPEVSARGVQGLNTILSGTYIEGTWDNRIGQAVTEFLGDERAPIVPPGVRGTAIVLRARDSSRLGPGAPILYRGIEVGQVAEPRLSPDGTEVRVDAFVLYPYDRRLSTATRFWDASGVSATLGAGGVELRIGSIASILEGGVNFDTLISGGDPIRTGHVYSIFDDEDSARASTFDSQSLRSVRVSALFPAAASGLTEGSPIRYRGVRVGVVSDITGFIRPDDPSGQVQLLAVMSLQPVKMGLETMTNDLQGIDFIGNLVRQGMRAKLVSTSILGGDLAIDLINDPEALPDVGLEIGVAATPLVPTLDADIQGLTASAESVLERINELPIEELLASATTLLDNVNRIAGDADTRAIPSEALALLTDARGLVRDGRGIISSPQVASVLADVQTIAADVREVTAALNDLALPTILSETLTATAEAARNVAAGTVALDELTASVQTLVADADALITSQEVQALPGAALGLLEDGRGLLNSDEVETILTELAVVSADIRVITQQLAQQEAAARLTAALDAAAEAATSVARGTANLPELSQSAERVLAEAEALGQNLNTLTEKANQLALDELVNATTDLMTTADAFLSSDEADDVPIVLAATLEELRLTIETIRTGGTLDNLNTTLRSAAGAADSIRVASGDLPALVNRLQTLTTQAGTLLGTYSDGSRVNTELFAALRAATRAAEDVSSLARTIERNPNSLLLGR
ncbi:intermembrane transport protein PqiB [Jannaschia pohangensis]|uniref:Paraquat-inducible protein B n=1 Tax=Jannaschia pohangensis TaxID=390807 RepID=A0A1I3JX39_9RHOB|nr:MlaD family protein [Jannaschia pohangensis]SFI64640.1 paraquat-inducible protein B [Jannaschia pohangensis]